MAYQCEVRVNGDKQLSGDSTSRSARGVYGISVASELSGIGPQTLRLYERWGLLTPSRTAGGTRRYSDNDLDRLKQITELVDQGVNLAGIVRILDLESRNSQLELDNAQLKADRKPPASNSASNMRPDRNGRDGRRAGR